MEGYVRCLHPSRVYHAGTDPGKVETCSWMHSCWRDPSTATAIPLYADARTSFTTCDSCECVRLAYRIVGLRPPPGPSPLGGGMFSGRPKSAAAAAQALPGPPLASFGAALGPPPAAMGPPWVCCHASAEQSRQRVLPVPVGDSSSAFSPRCWRVGRQRAEAVDKQAVAAWEGDGCEGF